ncbi:3'-5' exonuclease [Pelovirga terrestris]|uniref:3'-5' exonuclease n=1 Tax=Pelovirga terrestris TaxID=2771352 RepID=A0A8J6QQI8_9BACT|nr:3'-5' exonuclease [Pelovirga terrestris]MBD1399940.1 3'-5' exonuclease [Pelovirga terrestris]
MLYLKSAKKPSDHRPPQWPQLFDQLAISAKNPGLKQYYQAGVVAPETPLSDVSLVALDIETTGLDPARDAIVSVGLIPFDLHRIYCSKARYWVLNPEKPLTTSSVVIHGITHAEALVGHDLKQILPELLLALAHRVVVVHCRQIERRFLDIALKERIGEGIVFPAIDTMEIDNRYVRRRFFQRIVQFFGRTPESIRLAACRSRYHLPHYTPHHALIDALATAELFQAQVAWHFTPQTWVDKVWH